MPDSPNYSVLEVRSLDSLRRVVMSDFTSHDLTLVFADEKEDIVVDTRVEHFPSGADNMADRKQEVPEVSWTLVIQNHRDRDRLLKLLCRQWSELNEGKDLSVQVSS